MNSKLTLRRRVLMAGAVTLTVLLTACGGGSGGDSDSRPKTGTASFDITDAPADDVTVVKLTFSAIALKSALGVQEMIEFDEPVVIDNLLALQGANFAALLPDTDFPAGRYNWIRLYVVGGGDDSYVMTDEGGKVDLFVPGQQSGNHAVRHVQLVSGFVIPRGGNVDFTIDVDLRKALTKPKGKDYYLLRPAMHITDNSHTGTISGTVADALLMNDQCGNDLVNDEGNAVYLYVGGNAVTGDVYLDDLGEEIGVGNPFSVANVKQNIESGLYEYSFGFVPEGAYTVAFTCNSLLDMPDHDDDDGDHDDDDNDDDDFTFSQSATIQVTAGVNTDQDFVVAP